MLFPRVLRIRLQAARLRAWAYLLQRLAWACTHPDLHVSEVSNTVEGGIMQWCRLCGSRRRLFRGGNVARPGYWIRPAASYEMRGEEW